MSNTRFGFSRASRLLKPAEFQLVFDARKACRGQWLTIHNYQPATAQAGAEPLEPVITTPATSCDASSLSSRLGLIVAKRLVPAAARRNLIRRVIREYFRTTPTGFPAGDWIVRLHESPFRFKKGQPSPTRLQIVTALRNDLIQITRRIAAQAKKSRLPTV